ncbi:HTH-type transcriptional repressor ComR [Frankliniella fusca]|uniref:HTH-type transcriptional repressor ComR n=1 Tax=Frankliniella fusca TaxID=407009 RepID=A0AAE1LVM2_9NEOP|nr:HTH-type transcriptional repressor ComR [Frankliniella fusca]
MLHSVEEILSQCLRTSRGRPRQANRMRKIDRGMLAWVTKFLQEFKEETKILEGNDHPTLPFVTREQRSAGPLRGRLRGL